jgi:hypothetical protein
MTEEPSLLFDFRLRFRVEWLSDNGSVDFVNSQLLPSMSLKRLRSSAAISGSDRSSDSPTLRKLARCASKLGSTETGSAILSDRDCSLYRAFVDVKKELELTINSTRNRVMASFIVAEL